MPTETPRAATHRKRRLTHLERRMAAARTPEERIVAAFDAYRSAVANARKRSAVAWGNHSDPVPGLDARVDGMAGTLAEAAADLESAARVTGHGRRT